MKPKLLFGFRPNGLEIGHVNFLMMNQSLGAMADKTGLYQKCHTYFVLNQDASRPPTVNNYYTFCVNGDILPCHYAFNANLPDLDYSSYKIGRLTKLIRSIKGLL
jgi:hypothetical protein